MTTRYLDLEGGNNSNDGSTFALRKKTMANVCSGLTGGDTVRVMASKDPTSMGQNATLTNGSDTVTLTTAVTANIDTCETAWTPSANVTAAVSSTTQREGTNAVSLAIAGAFTTGLIAFKALGSAVDFSAYQQVSFLIRQSGTFTTVAANTFSVRLCSDVAGVTAVNSFTINVALGDAVWTAVVGDNAGALGSSIQSIAIYALLDPGTPTVFLDNIIACKASSANDSLTHWSLIGKNTGTEPWMAIDTINGTTVKLGGGYMDTASRSGFQPYYYGTTATQTLYKREPIVIGTTVSPGNGTNGATLLNIECGWDRTAMSSQSGQSFVRFINPALSGTGLFDASTATYGYLNKWYSVNAIGSGIITNSGWTLGEVGAIACSNGFGSYQATDLQAVSSATRYAMHCGTGVKFAGSLLGYGTDTRLRLNYLWGFLNTNFANPAISDTANAGFGRIHVYGADIQGHYCYSGSSTLTRGGFAEIVFQNCTIKNLNRDTSGGPDKVFLTNCTLSSITNQVVPSSGALYFTNQGGDTTSHKIVFGNASIGSITSDTSTRNTASDFSWKFTPGSGGGGTLSPGLVMSIAKIACIANEQRTVTAYLRRDNTGLSVRLRVKGGYVSGIDDDVNAACSAAINTWQQVTLQFTPTQQCVVEVFAEAYGQNSSNGWIDDLGVS